jgi:hypothetical protein
LFYLRARVPVWLFKKVVSPPADFGGSTFRPEHCEGERDLLRLGARFIFDFSGQGVQVTD